MTQTAIDTALKLFTGRSEAVGTEEGGALRINLLNWPQVVREHFLYGLPSAAIGVYPLYIGKPGGWVCSWGCIDYDEGEQTSYIHAENTRQALKLAAGITAHVERSRRKGYHVWVFAAQPVPAETMRTALLATAQIVNAPMREINPKQTELGWDDKHNTHQLGNYVRLPYPGMFSGPEHRRVVIDDNGVWLPFETFIDHAWNNRSTLAQLQTMATKYVAPPKAERRHHGNIDPNKAVLDRLDGLSYKMFMEGPAEWLANDFSAYLWKLANTLIAKSELTDEEAVGILIEAHNKFKPQKFGDRAELELSRMLEKASREYV